MSELASQHEVIVCGMQEMISRADNITAKYFSGIGQLETGSTWKTIVSSLNNAFSRLEDAFIQNTLQCLRQRRGMRVHVRILEVQPYFSNRCH